MNGRRGGNEMMITTAQMVVTSSLSWFLGEHQLRTTSRQGVPKALKMVSGESDNG